MLQRIYSWTLNLASHKHALFALALIAFVESSIFPIPPDIILIPMIYTYHSFDHFILG